ncbi:MAG: hypothetical protein CJBNEKGG_03973 [Prosthecobacter sp.]|nr:hypothetical protein [Prosthecobacter sp.]
MGLLVIEAREAVVARIPPMNCPTTAILALYLTCRLLHASDNMPPADPDLPQPLDAGFATLLVSQSPFTRSVNLEQTLQLTGVAYINGRPVATVLDKQTKERILLTEEANVQGWRLLAVEAGTDPTLTQVQVMIGPETLTMHYHGLQAADDGKGGVKAQVAGHGSRKDSGKQRPSDLLGKNGRELYAALSKDARDKFRDAIKARLEKSPELTREQTSEYAQKLYGKLKAADQGEAAGARPPKSAKPPKKKQGA